MLYGLWKRSNVQIHLARSARIEIPHQSDCVNSLISAPEKNHTVDTMTRTVHHLLHPTVLSLELSTRQRLAGGLMVLRLLRFIVIQL